MSLCQPREKRRLKQKQWKCRGWQLDVGRGEEAGKGRRLVVEDRGFSSVLKYMSSCQPREMRRLKRIKDNAEVGSCKKVGTGGSWLVVRDIRLG